MIIRVSLLATVLGLATLAAAAQQQGGAASSGQMQMPSPFELPAACRAAAESGGHLMQGSDMQGGMMQSMQGMMGKMDDAHKAYMQSMMKMHQPMMQAMMAKDPDVAFVCMMIPHHMGAIENARIVLRYGDNAEAKKLAQETLQSNEKEVKELKAWVEKHAKKEGN